MAFLCMKLNQLSEVTQTPRKINICVRELLASGRNEGLEIYMRIPRCVVSLRFALK